MGLLAIALVGCSKAADATTTPDTSKDCSCSVVLSEPVWRFGTLCLKGELSQGHGVNKNGQEVAGCVTIKSSCVCKEHVFNKPAVVLPGQE